MNEPISKGRAKKAREFLDRESAGSQSLWTLIASLQAVFLGIFSISSSSNEVPTSPFLLGVVFALSITTMTILVYLATISRNIDSRIAAYFEIIKLPRIDRPSDYDDEAEKAKNEDDFAAYRNRRVCFEIIAFIGLILNILILCVTTFTKCG